MWDITALYWYGSGLQYGLSAKHQARKTNFIVNFCQIFGPPMDIMVVLVVMQHKPRNFFMLSFLQKDDYYKNWEIIYAAYTEVS